MKPTSSSVETELENFLAYLTLSEIAYIRRPVLNSGQTVSWQPHPNVGSFLPFRAKKPSLDEYSAWVQGGQYSALLFDGALLQITFNVDRRGISGHRLAYVPCPFEIDPDHIEEFGVIDAVDMYSVGRATDVVLNAAVRFDYDPVAAAADHPAAHLTINTFNCRIACAAPLRLGHFADFVFRHFYPDLWKVHPFFDLLTRKDWGPRTITSEQEKRLHIAWSS